MTATGLLAPAGRLADLTIGRDRLTGDVLDAVTAATLTLATEEASELKLTIEDPDLRILGTGLLAGRPWVNYGPLRLEVAAVATTDGAAGRGGLEVAARPRAVQALKRRPGPAAWSNVSPSDVVALAARSVGAPYIAQPSPRRAVVAVKGPSADSPAESVWGALARLATELGYVLFESAGTIFFGRPTWLLGHAGTPHSVRWAGAATAGDVVSIPRCRRSVDADDDHTRTVEVDLTAELALAVLPGTALGVTGVPTFEGIYLVTGLEHDLGSGAPVTVQAATAEDPEPQPPDDGDTHADTAPAASSTPAAGPPAVLPSGGWADPLPGAPVTSRFGPRQSPGGIGSTNHKGVDLGAPGGTRILAAQNGRVSFAGWSGGYGNLVKIDHGSGIETRYGHQQRIAVQTGQNVSRGEVIGYVDSTGSSTGNHLHYEVRRNGVAINPIPEYLAR